VLEVEEESELAGEDQPEVEDKSNRVEELDKSSFPPIGERSQAYQLNTVIGNQSHSVASMNENPAEES